MCMNQCKGGISGQVTVIENTERQGQCSICMLMMYPGFLCGEEKGKLVCGNRVREKKLPECRYGPAILSGLVFINNLPKVIKKIAA